MESLSYHQDKKGNILQRNLKPEEQRGLRSLAKKVREKELIVQKTDKAGDLALNSHENYLESLRPHFHSDPDLSWEDHAKLESELNACSIQFARVLRVGAKWGHWPRVKSAELIRSEESGLVCSMCGSVPSP